MPGCPDCGGPLITDPERGEVVCTQCGLVVAEYAVDMGPEWRAYNERDKEKRERTAPLKLVIKTDMAVRPEHGAQWRKLAKFHKETLHSPEWRMAEIGAELRRVKECVGLPQSVVEEAEALLKKHLRVVKGYSPDVAAVALLWSITKAAGEPRPLDDFLKCSRADKGRVRKAAWRLKEVMRLGRRPSFEDYVSTLAARVNLPATTAKAALDILKRNRRVLAGKNPWVWAAAALWVAWSRRRGLLAMLAEAAGSAPSSVRDAAKQLRL
jgi:transcription initiation factor TFIIB